MLAALASLLCGSVSFAQAPATSPVPATQASSDATASTAPAASATEAPAPAAKVVTHPIAQAAIRYIDDQAAQGPLAREKDLLEALKSLYTDRDKPLWTSNAGLGANAHGVIEEIGRADDWGLKKSAFETPVLAAGETSLDAIGAADVALSYAVAKYAWHAQGGRLEPTALSLWLDQRARPLDVSAILSRVADNADPADALRKLHPQHPQFELLRQAYLKARGKKAEDAPAKPLEVIPPGPVLKPGMHHDDVAILRRRLDVPAGDDPTHYDSDLADAVRAALKRAGLSGSPLVGTQARAALNANKDKQAAKARPDEAKRILANMERWRWLPADLGSTHVWNNLPEFETRVFKDGKVIHQERIVIGKPETQTPVFSDAMRVVVFLPDWGVPNSIKIKDLLPQLQEGNDDVLSDRGMRIAMNGKTVDPGKIKWDKVDIRTIPIVQDPGPSNPLGQIKFLFPNKHDVYMHDTPTKHLFNSSVRTFSHGCIRVRNPKKLAEVVFGEDQGWEPKDIADRLTSKATVNNRVPLNTRIPVHNVYFTAIADEHGNVRTLNDVYGHDKRIIDALDGVPASTIAQSDPARRLARELQEISGDPSDGPVARANARKTAQAVAAAAKPSTVGVAGRSALGGPVPSAKPQPAPKAVVLAPEPVRRGNSQFAADQARVTTGQ